MCIYININKYLPSLDGAFSVRSMRAPVRDSASPLGRGPPWSSETTDESDVGWLRHDDDHCTITTSI